MDSAKLGALRADVVAAERQLDRLKQSWADARHSDPLNTDRTDLISSSIEGAEDTLRVAKRALADFES